MTSPLISANDTRKYRHLRLANQLEVLLIEDPETDKSSACCDVRIGSMADPLEAQGLAHFLEHMLFMGTTEYPEENQYSSYLNNHGGHSNAYTSLENTVYYFDIQNDAFQPGLSMFSSFFTCPLFLLDSIERELHAVDSENQKNLQSDSWRHYQLLKSLAIPTHPFSQFATGNLMTLKEKPLSLGLNIRDMVIDFYNRYYSANIMKLVVYGKESLDTLQQWVEPLFSRIPNKDLISPRYDSIPFDENIGVMLDIVPIKDVKELELLFLQIPTQQLYLSKPDSYISHLVGHESEGSILAALKEKGWATGLSSYTAQSLTDFSVLGIEIELTDAGMQNIDEIAACVFAYFGMLRQQGEKEWIQQEIKDIKDMNFRFISKSSPSNYATSLANNMHIYPPEHIVSGGKLIYDLDISMVSTLLSQLVPSNCILAVKSKAFAGKTSMKETHYGTNYNLRKFAPEQLALWTQSGNETSHWRSLLSLPIRNPFIATKFALTCNETEVTGKPEEELRRPPSLLEKKLITLPPIPEQVTDIAPEQPTEQIVVSKDTQEGEADELEGGDEEEGDEEHEDDNEEDCSQGFTPYLEPAKSSTIWFKQDRHWKVPKVNITLVLETLEACNSACSYALTDLLSSCLKEILNEYAYYADCAGLYHDTTLSKGGLELSFAGYNEKLPELAFKTADELRKLGTDAPCSAAVYDRCRQKLLRQYKNYKYSQPYYLAMIGSYNCLEDPRWTDDEKYNALLHSSLAEFHVFCNKFVRCLSVEAMIVGNMIPEDASKFVERFREHLQCRPLPLGQLPSRRVVKLEPGIDYVYRQHGTRFNPKEANSAVENVYVIGEVQSHASELDTSVGSKLYVEAMLTFVAHILSEPAFDQLRTKEQLGYIVHTAIKKFGTTASLHIIVQSSHKSPEFLDKRVEEFLLQYCTSMIPSFTEELISTNIHAVLEMLLEKPKNLNEEFNRNFGEVKLGAYLFERKKHLADLVKQITLAAVIEFVNSFLLPNPCRRKLSSQLFSAKHAYPTDQNAGEQIIEDALSFRRSMPLNHV